MAIRKIAVNFEAGTGNLLTGFDQVTAKVREFGLGVKSVGHGTASSMQAASGAIRELEGNFTNNIRAVERFLSTTLKLGPIIQAAFPLVGGIAFLGLLAETSKKATEFFREMQNAPERIRGVFNGATSSIRLTNDELRVANDRLENDIAKLTGHHQNTLALAMDEARAMADRLAQSLDKDLEALNKLIEAEDRNVFQKFFGTPGEEEKQLGGESGFGGVRGDVSQFMRQQRTAFGGAKSEAERDNVIQQTKTGIMARYGEQIDRVEQKLEKLRQTQKTYVHDPSAPLTPGMGHVREVTTDRNQKQVELLTAEIESLQQQKDHADVYIRNAGLIANKEKIQAGHENDAQERPLDRMIAQLTAKVDEAKARLKAAGLDETNKAIAKAEEEAIAAIEHANIALAKQSKSLTLPKDPSQSPKGREALGLAITEQRLNLEAALRDKVREVADSTRDQIQTQQMLNEAIGKGWEAQKKVNVEVELMKKFGATKYNEALANPLSDQFAAISAARPQATAAVEDTHTTQSDERLRKLENEIALENVLTQAQALGAKAVEQAAFAEQLRQQKSSQAGLSEKEERKAWLEFYAERANKAAAEVAKIDQEIAGIKRVTAAAGEGAEAMRKAALENKYAAMAKTPQGTPEAIDAERTKDELDHQQKLTDEAMKTGMAFKNSIDSIDLQLKALDQVKVSEENALAIEISRRNLQNERLDLLVKESLQMRGASDGVRAFFLEMQKDAESAAAIVYRSLNSAVDQVSANFAKMFTQKAPKGGWGQEWAKSFQSVGGETVQSSLKSLMQKGLGKLGAKMDGSSPSSAFWVRWQAAHGGGAGPLGSSTAGGAPGSGAAGGKWGSVFGGSAGGGIFNFLGKLMRGPGSGSGLAGMPDTGGPMEGLADMLPDFGGFMADGGPVSPSSAYVVGENGPEVLTGASGRIASNAEMTRTFGGAGGTTNHYHVDARGADLGAHNRIMRALEATHKASVEASVRAVHERSFRNPKGH